MSEEPFVVRNPAVYDKDGDMGIMAEEADEGPWATVRITGFTGCDFDGVAASVTIESPFTLEDFESADLVVQFNPPTAGEWDWDNCALYPEWEVLSKRTDPDVEATSRCHLSVVGTSVIGPEPSCALRPGAEFEFGEVEARTSRDVPLTISNETQDVLTTNQFKFLFDGPSRDCRLFTIDPADTVGVLGPGESKDITVRFQPDAAGNFECVRSLSSLREPADAADPLIADACPTEVYWRGTGVAGSFAWRDCSMAGVGNDLHGITGLSETDVLVAGDAFTVLASSGSCEWEGLPGNFSDVNLTDIWAHSTATEKAIWVVGNIDPPPGQYGLTGAILRSDGSAWEKVDEGWMVTYGALWGSAFDDVYFVGTGVSTDMANAKYWNGSEIDTLSIDWGMSQLSGVNGTASDDIWAVVHQSWNSVYQFRGAQWENQTLPFTPSPLNDVWAVQGSDFYTVYAVGDDGAIYHYDGSNWTDESISGETHDFYGVWVSQTGQAWVVGEGGAIYHKSGSGWSRQNPPPNLERTLMDVWGSSDENVFAVGAEGLILHYSR